MSRCRRCPLRLDAHDRGRSGLALPAAIFALAIITLFIAGTAFATTQESRASVGSLGQRLALEAAEYGALAVLRDWDRAWNLTMAVGATRAFSHALAGGASSEVRLTRTGSNSWWAISAGAWGSGGARRSSARVVNAVYRLDLAAEPFEAALSVTDSVRVAGGGMVSGTDSAEVILGACGAGTTSVAGVGSPDTTRTCDGACGTNAGGVIGVPRLLVDTGVALRIAALSGRTPDIVLPPGAVITPGPVVNAGGCDTSVTTNWGDPAGGACATRMPVIRALGDLTVSGGVGQGILIAGGDLFLEGGALFMGIVVAGDDIVTGAGGATVLGAALAGDARRSPGDHSRISAGGLVRRSSCRIRQARMAAAPPVRVAGRWWAEFE